MQLGIVGAGMVARLHASAAAAAGTRVAGVCDVDRSRADALAAEHPGAAATDALEEMLARPDLDAVVVAVPNALHRDVAVAALRAGKDVLLEKPMAMNVAECDEIIGALGAAGRVLQMGFVCRCAPAAVAAREMVAAGRLGRVYAARANLQRRRGIPGLGRWFTTRSLSGGGVLMDLGVHLVDLVMHLTGFPRPARAGAVTSATFGRPIARYRFEEMWCGPPDPVGVFDVEDGAAALVRFEDGMSFQLNVAWATDMPQEAARDVIVLLGDRGGCMIDLWANRLVVTVEKAGRPRDTVAELPPVDAWETAWRGQHERFARSVAERSEPQASAGQGRAVQAIIDALYRSAAAGAEVAVI